MSLQPAMPDGLYITWLGRTRPAMATAYPPKTVLVHLDPEETAPTRYERDGDEKWIFVPLGELTEMFTLRTSCQWNSRRCQVTNWEGPNQITIAIQGIGQDQAILWGATPTWERGQYVATIPTSEVVNLQQERHNIPLE